MGSFPLQGLGLWHIETKKIDLRKTVLCWNSETLQGVLGPKNDGGVPLAAENWTQKDRGKNEIWGLKDRIL